MESLAVHTNRVMLEPLLSKSAIQQILIQHYGNDDYLDCVTTINNFTTNLFKYPFWEMVENSARDSADMGDPRGCSKLGNDSKYIV